MWFALLQSAAAAAGSPSGPSVASVPASVLRFLDHPVPLPPGTAPYRVDAFVASGGEAHVFAGTDLRGKEPKRVAIRFPKGLCEDPWVCKVFEVEASLEQLHRGCALANAASDKFNAFRRGQRSLLSFGADADWTPFSRCLQAVSSEQSHPAFEVWEWLGAPDGGPPETLADFLFTSGATREKKTEVLGVLRDAVLAMALPAAPGKPCCCQRWPGGAKFGPFCTQQAERTAGDVFSAAMFDDCPRGFDEAPDASARCGAIVHHDLKFDNVIVKAGKPVIVDWGAAALCSSGKAFGHSSEWLPQWTRGKPLHIAGDDCPAYDLHAVGLMQVTSELLARCGRAARAVDPTKLTPGVFGGLPPSDVITDCRLDAVRDLVDRVNRALPVPLESAAHLAESVQPLVAAELDALEAKTSLVLRGKRGEETLRPPLVLDRDFRDPDAAKARLKPIFRLFQRCGGPRQLGAYDTTWPEVFHEDLARAHDQCAYRVAKQRLNKATAAGDTTQICHGLQLLHDTCKAIADRPAPEPPKAKKRPPPDPPSSKYSVCNYHKLQAVKAVLRATRDLEPEVAVGKVKSALLIAGARPGDLELVPDHDSVRERRPKELVPLNAFFPTSTLPVEPREWRIEGETLLTWAARFQNPGAVDYLLAIGCDPAGRDRHAPGPGAAPQFQGLEKQATLAALAPHPADFGVEPSTQSALFAAAQAPGGAQVLRRLLAGYEKQAKAQPWLHAQPRPRPPHWSLLALSAPIVAPPGPDAAGRAAALRGLHGGLGLQLAATGDDAMLEVFLAAVAAMAPAGAEAKLALQAASEDCQPRGHEAVMALLPEECSHLPLFVAAQLGHTRVVERLLAHARPAELARGRGLPPLFAAAASRQARAVTAIAEQVKATQPYPQHRLEHRIDPKTRGVRSTLAPDAASPRPDHRPGPRLSFFDSKEGREATAQKAGTLYSKLTAQQKAGTLYSILEERGAVTRRESPPDIEFRYGDGGRVGASLAMLPPGEPQFFYGDERGSDEPQVRYLLARENGVYGGDRLRLSLGDSSDYSDYSDSSEGTELASDEADGLGRALQAIDVLVEDETVLRPGPEVGGSLYRPCGSALHVAVGRGCTADKWAERDAHAPNAASRLVGLGGDPLAQVLAALLRAGPESGAWADGPVEEPGLLPADDAGDTPLHWALRLGLVLKGDLAELAELAAAIRGPLSRFCCTIRGAEGDLPLDIAIQTGPELLEALLDAAEASGHDFAAVPPPLDAQGEPSMVKALPGSRASARQRVAKHHAIRPAGESEALRVALGVAQLSVLLDRLPAEKERRSLHEMSALLQASEDADAGSVSLLLLNGCDWRQAKGGHHAALIVGRWIEWSTPGERDRITETLEQFPQEALREPNGQGVTVLGKWIYDAEPQIVGMLMTKQDCGQPVLLPAGVLSDELPKPLQLLHQKLGSRFTGGSAGTPPRKGWGAVDVAKARLELLSSALRRAQAGGRQKQEAHDLAAPYLSPPYRTLGEMLEPAREVLSFLQDLCPGDSMASAARHVAAHYDEAPRPAKEPADSVQTPEWFASEASRVDALLKRMGRVDAGAGAPGASAVSVRTVDVPPGQKNLLGQNLMMFEG